MLHFLCKYMNLLGQIGGTWWPVPLYLILRAILRANGWPWVLTLRNSLLR